MNNTLTTAIGLTGALLFLFAFYRTSIGRWTGKSLWYELDNLLGAVLMTIYALQKAAYINILLNVVWGIVAIRGLSSIGERRKPKTSKSRKK
jgi:lipid-A-disaccharide synthase-like uncharacterized protein